MALSTDITLPKHIKPVFPELCIVCHSPPNSTTKIAHNSHHWALTFFLPVLALFGWSRTEIPICRSCKARFYFQRWGRTLLCWTITATVVVIAWPYFEGWSPLTKKLALIGLAIVACVPYGILEVHWPRVLETTAGGAKLTYEFRSTGYAAQFYSLNRKHVLKSDIEVLWSFRLNESQNEE